ncbi:MAG: RagB/SusD family nutrient uptake outer membrane protein [Bacteroidales bacterium]
MNRFKSLCCLICLVGALVSCQGGFLDETVTSDLDKDKVFSDSSRTEAFLVDAYTQVGFEQNPSRYGDGGLQTAVGEMEPQRQNSVTTPMQFASGTVSATIISDDAWTTCYKYIRKVNAFLENVGNSPLSESLQTRRVAEARFLRAWYYAILLRHYGGVPLIGDWTYDAGEDVEVKRNTFAETVDYIVKELDEAAKDLPTAPSGANYGRAGAGACMSLKSRILLHAASPLLNGSDFANDRPIEEQELVKYTSYDENRWVLARDAARAVISTGAYTLHDYINESGSRGSNDPPYFSGGLGFYQLFIASNFTPNDANKGIIFELMVAEGNGRESAFLPGSRGGNGKGGYPYQELVDAFPMINGLSIDDAASGYNEHDPFEGRDPRFYHTILYDQCTWNLSTTPDVPIDIFSGNYRGRTSGDDLARSTSGTPTGYYSCKFLRYGTHPYHVIGGPQSRPVMRYAEILLNYAEAENEINGANTEVYTALTEIRKRAGIEEGSDGLYGLKSGMSKGEMREAIRKEREIELALEGFRFFDVRRWMIADETENRTYTGMEVYRQGETVEYIPFDVRIRVFRTAMYYWPIPYAEVAKSPELVQNPYY